MKQISRAAALLGASALVLAACGAPPADTSGSGGSDSGAAPADAKVCMVSDQGGFDDKSFNESSHDGLVAIKDKTGVKTQTAESNSPADFSPNLQNMANQGCTTVFTVGFLLATETGNAAKANPNIDYAIVDATAADADGNPIELDNVKPIVFDTAQAAYLAGYTAAGMSKTGVVATYGGMKIPSVTIFMDGFVDGVNKYNEVHGTDVKVLGWNKEKQDGSFTDDFSDQTKGKSLTEGFINQKADVIMPVAGPVGAGTLAAAKEHDGVMVIWVDADGVETNPDSKDVILTSVVKLMGNAVESVAQDSMNGEFNNTPYVGNLENGGVNLAPFHEFDSQVPDDLKKEVEQLKQDIIDGTITVESPASPQG